MLPDDWWLSTGLMLAGMLAVPVVVGMDSRYRNLGVQNGPWYVRLSGSSWAWAAALVPFPTVLVYLWVRGKVFSKGEAPSFVRYGWIALTVLWVAAFAALVSSLSMGHVSCTDTRIVDGASRIAVQEGFSIVGEPVSVQSRNDLLVCKVATRSAVGDRDVLFRVTRMAETPWLFSMVMQLPE